MYTPMVLYKDDEKNKIKERIGRKSLLIKETIESKKDELEDLILEYESFATFKDETWRSIDCLENIDKELLFLSSGKVGMVSVFLPRNLPLYSLMIFAVIPSFMSEEVVVRAPTPICNLIQNIYRILGLGKLTPNIKIVNLERSLFNEAYVSVSDVVLFSGKFKNAEIVQESCPNSLFIFNGAGVNPAIVFKSADIRKAVDKIIEARIFNSGQDCHGMDMIFVESEIQDKFIEDLSIKLSKVKIGNYRNKKVEIGHLLEKDKISEIKEFFEKHHRSIIYGGQIDFKNSVIYPTIIKEHLRDVENLNPVEFFSPVFYIVIFDETAGLKKYFNSKHYLDGAMYASVFGKMPARMKIPKTNTLENKILNDVERGNEPFGGYGDKANFVSYSGVCTPRPILISKEISDFIKKT